MKTLFAILFLSSFSASAVEIIGTEPIKGTARTKATVRGSKASCSVDVQKVRNAMEEDSYGNPAYSLTVTVSLSGNGVDLKKSLVMINLFKEGEDKRVVRDFDYYSTDGSVMKIDEDGRLSAFHITYNSERVKCEF